MAVLCFPILCTFLLLRFPFSSLPLAAGAGERRRSSVSGALPAADRGGGSARRAGLAGNWKAKLWGELEREALLGLGTDAAQHRQCSAAGEPRSPAPSAALAPESWNRAGAVPGRAMEGPGQEPHAQQFRGGARGEGPPGNAGQEGWVWC